MQVRHAARCGIASLVALVLVTISACQNHEPESNIPTPSAAATGPSAPAQKGEPLKDEVPASELAPVVAAHFQGLGHMERYEYADAIEAFRDVRRRAPGWIPGAINLAIALLNYTGEKVEAAKKSGGSAPTGNFDEALQLLGSVLERAPDNPYAHFCRGVILEQKGELAEANRDFQRVTAIDPSDAAAWCRRASSLNDPDNPGLPDMRKLSKKQVPLLEEALARDPYLTPALYRLMGAYRLANEPKKADAVMARWKELNQERAKPSPGPGNMLENNYGYMGKYATVVNPFKVSEPPAEPAAVPPRFDVARPLQLKLGEGEHWALPADFKGPQAILGRVRARFGAAVAAFDADGDGLLDLFLAAAVAGPKGVRDALLLNKGEGRFEDVSRSFGLADGHASVGVAAADFDADRYIDVFLTGVGGNRLLRNRAGKSFEDISAGLKPVGPPALALMARWLDLDQDGDLDLCVVNYCALEHVDSALVGAKPPPPGCANVIYRNDGQPAPIASVPSNNLAPEAVALEKEQAKGGLSIALVPWVEARALTGGASPHTGIAVLDLDDDRDLDVVFAADGSPLEAVLNDRLGQFHGVTLKDLAPSQGLSGLLVTDLDADGRPDLVAASADGPALAWRNTTVRATTETTRLTFEAWPLNAARWRMAQALDLDLDGWPDLLGLSTSSAGGQAEMMLPQWARNEGKKFAVAGLTLGLEGPGLDGVAAVDLVGDPLPDMLSIRPGEPPALCRNVGNGHHWLAVQLGGHWRVKPQLMRTNSHGIGTRVVLEGQGLYSAYDHTTPESGLGQSVAPVVLGLGRKETAELVHLTWPDAVMQCELNVASNQKLTLAENNRKTGSCPVLFTWNGRRFVCIGDFLGGGGLGYLIAPGVYSQPDRDESVAITAEQLRESGGRLRLSITEPMDEIAYLDHLRLDVVDRPPGVASAPDERFVVAGTRPSGELLAWKTTIEPVSASDLVGRDLTETLRHWDRRTADEFRKLDGWVGYAEEHGVVLDFGDRLSGYRRSDRLVLCLAGWVEYPYSQTNYAAATAGVALRAPSIERLRDDGRWETIEPNPGYPAGMPRLMTVDLTGKLTGPRCVLRIKTNMECYYDQAFVALRDPAAEVSLRVATVPIARATLGYRGYTREISPDGDQPLVYDYDHVDPAPLARFSGKLTRYGEVASLLQADDDQLCLIGPGDEVQLEFDATRLDPLPTGWTRSYVLRSFGYCKDADPFTATSDTVEPLPWRGMPPFPFGAETRHPADPAYESHLREFLTRPAGGGK
jgi:tetratricopeptide (TPR) repeat protein